MMVRLFWMGYQLPTLKSSIVTIKEHSCSSTISRQQDKLYMSRGSTLFLCQLLCVIYLSQAKPLFVRYSLQKEDYYTFGFFRDIKHGYFVEVGGYDPVYYSNSVRLGWEGITVEPDPTRHSYFTWHRPKQPTIRRAISHKTGQIVKLLDQEDSSMSTINQDWAQKYKNSNTGVFTQVRTITMADLCHRYYLRKPNFMSLDIEGHQFIALQSNDWSDDKCRPELIIVEQLFSKQVNLQLQEYLKAKAYQKFAIDGRNVCYVEKSKAQTLIGKLKAGDEIWDKEFQVADSRPLFYKIFAKMLPNVIWPQYHFGLTQGPYYVAMAYEHTKLFSFPDVLQYSRMSYQKDEKRPVLVMEYNPIKTSLFLGTSKYTLSNITVDNGIELLKFVLQYKEGTEIVYVLDYRKSNEVQVVIADEQGSEERVVYCGEKEGAESQQSTQFP